MNKIENLFLGKTRKYKFLNICKANKLNLDYFCNKHELLILSDIFENREYADYFPFYQKSTILDIGAHYGYFSIFAHKNTHPQSQILAIEPSDLNYKQICVNLKANNIENVIPIKVALGMTNGISTLYTGRSSNHSLIINYKLLKNENIEEKVNCKTLETVLNENNIEKVDFLKMDCEGSEYVILENLSSQCYDKITTVSLEFHDLKNEKYNGNFLINILMKHNFSIVKYQYMPTTMGLNYGKIIASKIKLV